MVTGFVAKGLETARGQQSHPMSRSVVSNLPKEEDGIGWPNRCALPHPCMALASETCSFPPHRLFPFLSVFVASRWMIFAKESCALPVRYSSFRLASIGFGRKPLRCFGHLVTVKHLGNTPGPVNKSVAEVAEVVLRTEHSMHWKSFGKNMKQSGGACPIRTPEEQEIVCRLRSEMQMAAASASARHLIKSLSQHGLNVSKSSEIKHTNSWQGLDPCESKQEDVVREDTQTGTIPD